MLTPEILRQRLELIHEFDQLQAHLEAGDESAIEPALVHIRSLSECNDMATLAAIIKAMATCLTDMQEQIDEIKGR
ncbi:MAG: hypothetical protein WCJ35_03350 [Planctomycetota bacterium]